MKKPVSSAYRLLADITNRLNRFYPGQGSLLIHSETLTLLRRNHAGRLLTIYAHAS